MVPWNLSAEVLPWIAYLAEVLDARNRAMLGPMLWGLLFAQGRRRTVSSWLRAMGVGCRFKPYYYFLGSLGRKCDDVAMRLVLGVIKPMLVDERRILVAIDDTPTKRYGPEVEGAGIHHNPTPGPAGQKFLYGHSWCTMAVVLRHEAWGAIGLPILARLYVRLKDIPRLAKRYRWTFQTKLQQAADLVEGAASYLKTPGKPLWVVADGAYAKRPFLRRALAAGAIVVSRLRKDAALWSEPKPLRKGERRPGPRPKYGKERVSLAKRAGHSRGWTTDTLTLYGRTEEKTYKTFIATYPPAGGAIRVVLVQEEHGWVAFFCTDPSASVADILEAVADRAALEQVFHDVKEVHGAGQPQLRHVWANIGAWNLTLWLHTLVEAWAWRRSARRLVDRRDSPWDNKPRRPSHADRCKSLRRECLQQQIRRVQRRRRLTRAILTLLKTLARRAT
jgi:hypothetical protein